MVFIHPWGCSLGARLGTQFLGNTFGQPAETALALSRLIFDGTLDRHPGLKAAGRSRRRFPAHLHRPRLAPLRFRGSAPRMWVAHLRRRFRGSMASPSRGEGP